ncbi:citrate transporter [Pseudothermotoga hypogea DSM 11164 = NBRC 106472]|uniref:Citrate transporter n=1 Tax=Pseudothermotoga hypogea DSM 11164 = NBRC 106472 TaxID=1123384 RepID=A0A0X1KPF5_9THEM|nr:MULTISPECIES: SLC13 family permease [Pseudothermotoga]AJC73133.1 citrate transporter [Pseudothermotoga hypogea DSM 11164 = NBRC 106472]MBC7123036.1 anion permease [Pseudothermotoga sp.]MDI6863762.1 SLC13 family permease [Pseudothermotoga sp.]
MVKQIVAMFLFFLAYYVILSRSRRTSVKVFLLGLIAAVLKLSEGLTTENISRVVDFNTIGLLLGMMIIVSVLKSTGFFQMASVYAVRLGRGNLRRTVSMLAVFIAILSAFLDNVTTLLIFAPILFLVSDAAEVDPSKVLVLGVIASNVGGMATMIGDPPNIVIGNASGLSFASFIVHLAPMSFLMLLISLRMLSSVVSVDRASEAGLKRLAATNPREAITDKKLLLRTATIFVATICAFAFHEALDIDMAFIALLGATLSLIVANKSFEDVAKEIEWDTLFFFMGLFSLTHVMQELGLLSGFASLISMVRSRSLLLVVLVWLSAVMGSLLSAVPTTVVLVPVVKYLIGLGYSTHLWWAIALGVGLGANLTPIGAAVNIVGISLLKRFTGKSVSFREFFQTSFAWVLTGLIIASLYMVVMAFVGW